MGAPSDSNSPSALSAQALRARAGGLDKVWKKTPFQSVGLLCTLYTIVLVALLRYMKVYKMCWCRALVHFGGCVGLVHLRRGCAGGCAQIVILQCWSYAVHLCTRYHSGSAQASLE